MSIDEMLQAFADSFRYKIDKDFALIVQFDIEDKKASWQVVIESGKVAISKGVHEQADVVYVITNNTLTQIYENRITASTAAGKAHFSDYAPLDWKFAKGLEHNPEFMAKYCFFEHHFFNRTAPEKILLGEEYSRFVHGGHVVDLYNHPGLRSGWYLLKKGERLNEPGDTNPFPQAAIFIDGRGFAKIGDKTVEVKAGESYYIPPDSDHVVWTESDAPLILIWLAWGEGA